MLFPNPPKSLAPNGGKRFRTPREWDAVLAHWEPLLRQVVSRELIPGHEADAMQMARIFLWEFYDQFPNRGSVAAWLTTIIRRRLTDYYRTTLKGEWKYHFYSLDDTSAVGMAVRNEAARLVNVEDDKDDWNPSIEQLEAMLPRLKPEVQQTIRLVMRGWSYAQIAEHLQVAEGTIKSRVARAIPRLRQALKGRTTSMGKARPASPNGCGAVKRREGKTRPHGGQRGGTTSGR